MITQYFDINQRQVIQAPGTLAPASLQPWVYADNYNLAIYLTGNGVYQPIGPNDSLIVMLFQPAATLPENNLAIVSTPVVKTDAAGFNYYQINVNLGTTGLANLVQANNQPAKCNFHYIFNPATGERFSSSADVPVTVNPDPSKDASGAIPVPPGYPTNPNVFEQIANKGVMNGYAGLDATGKVPVAQLPPSTAGGDMLRTVYDTDHNGVVDTCDSLQSSRVIGLGTAAVQNIPATGNAAPSQVVIGSDTRLADSRTPVPHQATHNGGGDPIPLASSSAQGLCPTLDGATIQIVSGKLTATTTGAGDMLKSVYDTNNDGIVDNAAALQTHVIPASGNANATQVVLGSDTRLADSRTPLPHQSTHLVGGADPIALASAAAAGLCPPVDNVSIQISAGKLAAILASLSAPGIVKPDGSTITIAGGVISAAAAPVGQHGCRYRNSAAISYPSAGAVQALTFDTSVFDTDSYSAAPNPIGTTGRITIPAGQGGYYAVGGCVEWVVTSGQTFGLVAVQLNGAVNTYPVADQKMFIASPPQAYVMSVQTVIHLNANDYIQLVVNTNVVASLGSVFFNLPNFFAMRIS